MFTQQILELERRNNEQKLKQRLASEKYERQQEALNLGIQIIAEQMKANTMAFFAGIGA